MQPTHDQVDALIDRGRSFHDLIDTRMRATDHQYDTIGGIDGKRQLAQFQRRWLVRYQCY